ncbi:MAG: hypothetical protein K0U84_20385 [Actinomycetia bacterium]|nr:hypothetical protein [Actinomycetes bacterium]
MSPNTFGELGSATPPPPPFPNHPPTRTGPPADTRGPRRWPRLAAAAAIGAVIAATVAALITTNVRDTTTAAPKPPPPVTVTVPAPEPPTPAPLPTAQANNQTCRQGWIPAGDLATSAQKELKTIPEGIKLNDPAILANPEWSATVQRAADLYQQSGDVLDANIAPGTTPILAEAAKTTVRAAHLLGQATNNADPAAGNAIEIANESAVQLSALCTRLAS